MDASFVRGRLTDGVTVQTLSPGLLTHIMPTRRAPASSSFNAIFQELLKYSIKWVLFDELDYIPICTLGLHFIPSVSSW